MKFLKLALVAVISLGGFSQIVSASTVAGGENFYKPETSANKNTRTNVAGFVIAARGSLTATDENGDVRSLARRSKFYANEILNTGEGSRAQLRFKDRALMTLKPKSQLNIGEYHFGGKKDPANKSFMSLVSGGFRTISGSIGKTNKDAYRISTPAASIGIRGTDYELIISLDGKVFAAVHDGGITLVNDIGELDLGSDSEYLFAEVGAGQSPLGLSEAPEVFKVINGEKTELSDEQQAKLKKKLAEGKERINGLLTQLGGEKENNDRGDSNDLPDNRTPGGAPSVHPDMLANLEGFALIAGNGEIKSGEAFKDGDEGAGEVIEVTMRTEDGDFLRFKPKRFAADPHESVEFWGTWSTAIKLGAGGSQSIVDFDDDKYFMKTRLMDAATVTDMTGRVSLGNIALKGWTSSSKVNVLNNSAYSNVTLDFDTKLVSGSFSYDVSIDSIDGQDTVGVDIGIDGAMLTSNGELNHDFSSSAGVNAESTYDISSITTVTAGILAEDGQGETGLAGGFSAALPNEVLPGVNMGGLFVLTEGGQAGRVYPMAN